MAVSSIRCDGPDRGADGCKSVNKTHELVQDEDDGGDVSIVSVVR